MNVSIQREDIKDLQRVNCEGLTFYRNEAWDGVRHGIFTRRGGVSKARWRSLNMGASSGDDISAVKENHARMYRAADVNPARAVSSWLVHGVETLAVSPQTRTNGHLEKADALITDVVDRPLVMRYADCVPLLLYDPVKRAIGLGHAGWRGTVQGMAARMVRAMRETYGSKSADIEVVIGPAISRQNYAVGEDVAAQAAMYFGNEDDVVWRDPATGAPHFDLWRANSLDLERAGVAHVEVLEICTFDNTQDFYSHRAENGKTGRFGVVISL